MTSQPDLVFRAAPSVRVLFGTLVPALLVIIGAAVLGAGGRPGFTGAYFVAAVLLWLGTHRATLTVADDGVTRTIIRRRFIPWSDVEAVDGLDGERASLRLRDGKQVALRPLEADAGSDDYANSVRVVHAVHHAYQQREMYGLPISR